MSYIIIAIAVLIVLHIYMRIGQVMKQAVYADCVDVVAGQQAKLQAHEARIAALEVSLVAVTSYADAANIKANQLLRDAAPISIEQRYNWTMDHIDDPDATPATIGRYKGKWPVSDDGVPETYSTMWDETPDADVQTTILRLSQKRVAKSPDNDRGDV